ncbi:hypothetical protein TeGR_g1614 [Tetraparma gracilis]|uniref:Uncharacterized protein n=1 Tax=Tetraparma gracilis TaxID=2962635 RepID=A0ABQ6NCA5_9STRA|nr:hypothetical protein TeGR_g1614 [Tetraparma gracilis]
MHSLSLSNLLTSEQTMQLARSFIDCVKISFDIVKDIDTWFDKVMPGAAAAENKVLFDNLKGILQQIGQIIRPFMKMARIGVTIKLLVSLFLTYFDLVTDGLVTRTFFALGYDGWAIASIAFVGTSILLQAWMTMHQYKKRPWRERASRIIVAALGLGPIVEGYQVWTGSTSDDKDLWMSTETMLSTLKAFEIAIESIPESVIQMSLFMGMTWEDVTPVQLVSLFSSFLAGAFITTEANLNHDRRESLSQPGSPLHGWVPSATGRFVRCALGMFLFNTFFFCQFVFTLSMLRSATKSFGAVAALVCAEFAAVLGYILIKREVPFPGVMQDGFLAWAVGIIGIFVFTLITNTTPMLLAIHPNAIGPEVMASIVCYRLVANVLVSVYSAGRIEAAVGSNDWLTMHTALGACGTMTVLCVVGLWLFFGNIDEEFDKGVFWRPTSGKQNLKECWEDEEIWGKKIKTKDEES